MKMNELIDLENMKKDYFGRYDLNELDAQVGELVLDNLEEIELSDYLKVREVQLLRDLLAEVRELVDNQR